MTVDETLRIDLLALAEAGDTEALEAAWLEGLGHEGPAEPFLAAFTALPDTSLRQRFVPSLELLLERCREAERHAEVMEILGHVAPFRRRDEGLFETARTALGKLHGDEDWHDLFVRLAGIEEASQALDEALERFGTLLGFVPGGVVYHRSGWGEGLILRHELPREEFVVRFRSDGVERSMPFTTGLDVLAVLDADDLRARLLVDMEGLQAEAESDPARLVRAVARLHKGRATSKEIKGHLHDEVVPARSWASWWRKAKAAALHDPWLAVENPSRPVFVLRQRALSAEDELRGAMDRARTLPELLEVVRGPLALDPVPELRDGILDALRGKVATSDEPVAKLEAALTLVRHGVEPPESATPAVEEAIAACGGFGALVGELGSASLRREAFDALVVSRPQLWSDAVIGELTLLPPQLLDAVCDRLVKEGRGEALANRFRIFVLAPSRQPEAVLKLARRFADGTFDGIEGAPSLNDVFMGVLHLAETQAPRADRGDKAAKEIMRRVEDVLVGRKGLAKRFVEQGTRPELELALGVLTRTRRMPDAIEDKLTKLCVGRFPDLAPRDDVPFWHRPGIFSSRDGIRARQAELRELIEEKIPQNTADIGRAASYGDLSENFEWAAAIEQQRQLTEKVAELEAELKLAQAIEDQQVDEGVVAPGTRVRYTDAEGGEKTISILGPWDRGEGVVSYRAPLAAGMLGARVGEQALLELPGGSETVTIEAVESLFESQS